MRSLPIGPEEAFVLSRVDGSTTESDIALATGLDSGRVGEVLERLSELGAITWNGVATEQPVRRPPPEPEGDRPRVRLTRPVIETEAEDNDHHHPAAALYDPAELDEDVDLDLPRKRRVLDLFYRLDQYNHYEVLGVEPSADKKAVKAAYYDVVAIFHPDKYYGKRLGSFKPKLERVFQRLTEAHDTLTRKKSREEYDDYLDTRDQTRRMDRMLRDDQAMRDELVEIQRRIEQEARAAAKARAVPSAPPAPVDPEARRRALARKLRSGNTARRSTPSPPPVDEAQQRAAIREVVADDLKRRYEARLATARDEQIERYVTEAKKAMYNDPVAAANGLRIAASLSPDDESIRTLLEEAEGKAAEAMADTYVEQARYEERNQRFDFAAKSYSRAARGKPKNWQIRERVAHCLLEGDGDVREAIESAREAVLLAPNRWEARLTLGRAYLQAGMKQSALGELERAAAIAPDDDTIKDWIKRAKRAD